MDYLVSFGDWLRQRRESLRLTRSDLAECAGCSVSALRKIEADERRPSRQLADLLGGCLRISPEEQPVFLDAARGVRPVARLGQPSPRFIPQPLPSPPVPSDDSSSNPAAQPAWNLPAPATPLLGREAELAALAQLLNDPGCRLLTLLGPGGIGKTRLAIEVACYVWERFPDGVHFAPLASVSSAEHLVPTIAQAVGLNFAGPAEPRRQLLNYLSNKQMLLLLDNLEHLLDGVDLPVEMLECVPGLKVLVTSRERLDLQWEWVFEVQGLPVPAEGKVEGVAKYSCIQLFLQRARQARNDFELSVENCPAVVRICRLVEGMPLALELAAAWVPVLSCAEIAWEIEQGLDILATRLRDVPERQRSLRAVFDHSWKMLPKEEQHVLRRLSVFRGGFQREAVHEVAGAGLPLLSALVAKSLVRRSGTGRYDLHELIRQFTTEQFAERPDERTATQARHGRYYLTFFGQADERLRSSAQRETLAELAAEIGNFRAAWDWAVTHGEFALIEQTMRLFAWFYDIRGWCQEALDTLGRAVDALELAHGHSPSDRTIQVALGHILTAGSFTAYRLGQYEQAQAMLERGLEILRPLNESRVLVESIYFLGLVMEVTGNYARALELYSEGLEMATAIGDRSFAALCRISLNELLAIAHVRVKVKPENAQERLRSVVADCRLIGDPRLTAFGLRILGESAYTRRRYDEARSALEESAALSSTTGDGLGLGSAYRGLGVVAQAQGKHQQAVDVFRKSLDTFTEIGGSWWVARVLAEMGRSILALGNEAEAEHIWRESLRLAIEIQGTPVALEALAGLASLQAEEGDMEYALELLLMVVNHPASFLETKNQASDLRADLEAQLTPTQIEAIQTQAAEKSFEAVGEDLLK